MKGHLAAVLVSFYFQLDTTCHLEEGTSPEELPSSGWPVNMSRRDWLMWEVPAHGGQCHP